MTITIVAKALVLPLDGSGVNVAEVGGKAAGLDRLGSHGFPVPEAVAVTVWAYRRFVEGSSLGAWLDDLGDAPIPPPDELADAVDELERRFLEAPMPSSVARAIETAARDLLAAGPVAVRSSATAEDLGAASFAGQYATFIDVDDTAGVDRAVRRCWASLWRPAARAYRRRNGIPDHGLAMGVVIQAMVQADWSGVAFTRDPGRRGDVMRIEVVPGLGEGLVSGRLTPEDFTVQRATLTALSTSGVAPPVFLEDLGRLLLQVEDRLDEPQDVEWAVSGGQLMLLQARPITVSGPTTVFDDGFDQPIGSSDMFTPRGVVEMLPGVVSPLLWTINAPMIEDAFRNITATLGDVSVALERPFLGRFEGRAALNLSALRDLATTLPGGSAAEVEQQFLGEVLTDEPHDTGSKPPGLFGVLRARSAQRKVADEVEVCAASARGIVDLEIDVEPLTAMRLLAYRHAIRDLAWRLVAAEVAASSAAAAAYRGLELLLHRWFEPEDAALWAQRLTAGTLADDAAGVQLSRRLQAAVDEGVRSTPGLRSAFTGLPAKRAGLRVQQLGESTRPFREQVQRVARSQGCRSVYAGATWFEQPADVWEQVAIQATMGPSGTASPRSDEVFAEFATCLGQRRGWRLVRVLTGQIVDLRARLVRRQAAEAARFMQLRERAKSALLTLGGEERRIIVEAARRLVASSQLEAASDVELLADGELEWMILGGRPPPQPDLLRRRTVRDRCLARDNLPATFVGNPENHVAEHATDAAILAGWAASPGVVAGTARVIHRLGEGGKLTRGDVLVAHATDPSWTPLLLVAGAIVLEEGGPLSHAAILAREFGVPAVLNVPGASSVICDGETVEVDGFAGIVRRHDDGRAP